jgi:hypothetical protein
MGASYNVVIVIVPSGGQAIQASPIYLDAEGHMLGRTICGDYRIPAGNPARIYPN